MSGLTQNVSFYITAFLPNEKYAILYKLYEKNKQWGLGEGAFSRRGRLLQSCCRKKVTYFWFYFAKKFWKEGIV